MMFPKRTYAPWVQLIILTFTVSEIVPIKKSTFMVCVNVGRNPIKIIDNNIYSDILLLSFTLIN